MDGAARRTLLLTVLAPILAGVALSVRAGGAGQSVAAFTDHGERVQRPAWPPWAHSARAVHAAPAEPFHPLTAMQPAPSAPRPGEFPPATLSGLDTAIAPAARPVGAGRRGAVRLAGITLRVPLPPPRAA